MLAPHLARKTFGANTKTTLIFKRCLWGNLTPKKTSKPKDAAARVEDPIKSEPGEGLRSVATTNVFRAVNFELYAKPVRPKLNRKLNSILEFVQILSRTGT